MTLCNVVERWRYTHFHKSSPGKKNAAPGDIIMNPMKLFLWGCFLCILFLPAPGAADNYGDGVMSITDAWGPGHDETTLEGSIRAALDGEPWSDIEKMYISAKVSMTQTDIDTLNRLGLKVLNIAESVTLDSYNGPLFSQDHAIEQVTLPVKHLAGGEFNYCSKLTDVFLPLLTAVDDGIFYDCPLLANVNMPALTTCGGPSFYRCQSLTDVDLPALTSIEDDAFIDCQALTTVNLPRLCIIGKEIKNPFTNDEEDITYRGNGFMGCTALTSINLPELSTIYGSAFKDCHALASATLPQLGLIYGNIFENCSSLTSATLHKVWDIMGNAFSGCKTLTDIELPKLHRITGNAFSHCESLTRALLPKITVISGSAFEECKSLEHIYLPKLTTIAMGSAFTGCGALFAVNLPELTHIESDGFGRCFDQTNPIISIPKLEQIKGSAFSNCPGLTQIHLPSLTRIGENAFYGCPALKDIKLPKLEAVEGHAFENCTAIVDVSLPVLAAIGENAFNGCTYLVTATLPKLVSIGKQAFCDCSDLLSVHLPELTTIGGSAFRQCNSLYSLNLPKLFNADRRLFLNTGLISVSVPKLTNLYEVHVYGDTCKQVIASDAVISYFDEAYADYFFGNELIWDDENRIYSSVFNPSQFVDTDEDTMDDNWERQYAENDLTILTKTGDDDQDDYPDVQEYSNFINSIVDQENNIYDPRKPNAPDTSPPFITSGQTAAPVTENSGSGQVVYTAKATDNNSEITFSLTNASIFSIGPNSGEVTLHENPDYGTNPSYSFTVQATDGAGNSSEKTVTLDVLPQGGGNEPSSLPIVLTDDVDTAVPSDFNGDLFGTSDANTINVQAGARLFFRHCAGSNEINLEEPSSDFMIFRSGATVACAAAWAQRSEWLPD